MVEVLSKYKKLLFISVTIITAFVIFFCIGKNNIKAVDSEDKIHFMRTKEAGGDAIVIESNGHCGLVDTLSESKSLATDNNRASLGYEYDNGTFVKNYIQNLGCAYLDFIILTHNHSDHIGGFSEISDLVTDNTIVFYKNDIVAKNSNNVVDDIEELANWHNHDYFTEAMNILNSKNSILCDVSSNNTNPSGKCYLPNIKNTYISAVNENSNPFTSYATNMDYTYYFDFGDFRINLYNLYHISDHRENLNSIVTLVTHKTGGAKTLLMADMETKRGDIDIASIQDKDNLILNPTGNCDECISLGLENQIADIVGKVDLLKVGHHGHDSSNSYYMLSRLAPSYNIITSPYYVSNNTKYVTNESGAMVAYLRHDFETKTYYTSQSNGALVAEFSDYDNLPCIENYNSNADADNDHFEQTPSIFSKWYSMNNLTSNDQVWVYVENGSAVTGFKDINNNTYFFDEHAIMTVGWKLYNANWFYFCEDETSCVLGSMQTGLKEVSYNNATNLYYFRTSDNDVSTGVKGSMVNGLVTLGDDTYYFRNGKDDVSEGPNGSALKNECTIIGEYYYCFGNDGKLISKTGLVSLPTSNLCNDLTYNGLSQTLVSSSNPGYTIANNSAINAGNYTVNFNINNYYIWADATTSSKSIVCYINKASLEPGNVTSYQGSYDGYPHTVLVSNVDFATPYYSVDGENFSTQIPTRTDVGTSKVYVKYVADSNHKDSDVYDATIVIEKTNAVIAENDIAENVVVGVNTLVKEVSANTSGTFTLSSSDETIFTIENKVFDTLENAINAIYVNGASAGSAVLTVSFTPDSENYNSVSKNYNLNVVEPEKEVVELPTTSLCSYPVYNGSSQNLILLSNPGYTVSNNNQTDAGDYEVIFSLNENYKWSDNTLSDKVITCYISKANLGEPNIAGYNGDYDENTHTITASSLQNATIKYSTDGVNFNDNKPSRTTAGTTTVYIKYIGDSNHNDSPTYQTNIVVNKATPTIYSESVNSTIKQDELMIFKKVMSNVDGVFTAVSSDTNVVSVNTSSINATNGALKDIILRGENVGNAQISLTFTPTDLTNYNIVGNTYNVSVSEPDYISVEIPTSNLYCKQNIKYNGSDQVLTNNPLTGYTFSNNVHSNVGTYNVVARLNDGYRWSDGTLTDKIINCSILKEDDYLRFKGYIRADNDNYVLSKIPLGTNYEGLYSNIETNGSISSSKSNSDIVTTCDTLTINFDNMSYTYTISVLGDVDKDNLINTNDVDLLFNYLRNRVNLSLCQIKAGDVYIDNKIYINDVAKLYQYISHKLEGLGD